MLNDQIGCFEDDIIEQFLEFISDEGCLLCEDDDAHLALEVDVINYILKMKPKCLFYDVQLDLFERETTKMEFDTMDLTSVLTSLGLWIMFFKRLHMNMFTKKLHSCHTGRDIY